MALSLPVLNYKTLKQAYVHETLYIKFTLQVTEKSMIYIQLFTSKINSPSSDLPSPKQAKTLKYKLIFITVSQQTSPESTRMTNTNV